LGKIRSGVSGEDKTLEKGEALKEARGDELELKWRSAEKPVGRSKRGPFLSKQTKTRVRRRATARVGKRQGGVKDNTQ